MIFTECIIIFLLSQNLFLRQKIYIELNAKLVIIADRCCQFLLFVYSSIGFKLFELCMISFMVFLLSPRGISLYLFLLFFKTTFYLWLKCVGWKRLHWPSRVATHVKMPRWTNDGNWDTGNHRWSRCWQGWPYRLSWILSDDVTYVI